jgi:hypothetical protein
MRNVHLGRAVSAAAASAGTQPHRKHTRSKRASCTALAVLALGVIGAPSTALAGPTTPPTGKFSCTASALRVNLLGGTLEPLVANPSDTPCQDDSRGLVGPINLGPISINGVLTARTDSTPAGAHAEAAVTKVAIGAAGIPAISADVLTSSTDANCKDGNPSFSSSGEVVNVRIGTTVIAIPANQAPVVLNIPLVGTLYLNEVVTTPTSITRRALRLDTLLLDVVIGESKSNVEGKPCEAQPPPPKPQCSDGIDNDGDGKIDMDDPGCLSGPKGSYNPNDDDETDKPDKPQCSDGVDNDGDKTIDQSDPQCKNAEDNDEAS